MRITELTIKNYKSFSPSGQTIYFPTAHSALVGKNNSGKTNILRALGIVLGSKNPKFMKFEEEDFFDTSQPIQITVKIGDFNINDKQLLCSLPNITKQQQGALNSKLQSNSAEITLKLIKKYSLATLEDDEGQHTEEGFEVNLWGFNVYRRVEDIRQSLIKVLIVPALRDQENELSASTWTQYGQLMKEVLENSSLYGQVKNSLVALNDQIQQIFASEKSKLLTDAQVASYVDDIEFQLTKNNEPSELLRNLEVFIKDNGKLFNIENVGTGTQNAVIIGILELALKSKSAKCRVFAIEEPEAFIHPHGIRYLGSLIRSITDDNCTQIIISTHSLSLVSNFAPNEIIKVDKLNGETLIHQNTVLSAPHFKRFIHQDNAEIFFSDYVLLIEGATEKHLLNSLDKNVRQDPSNPESANCNFDRINLGIIRMEGKNSINSYITILDAFKIKFLAILDRDFLNSTACKRLCASKGLTYQTTNTPQLISDLKNKQIFVIPQGEIEDIFSDTDIAAISGKTIQNIQQIKNYHSKTSDAFKIIFGMGKPEYAIKIAEYYITNGNASPVDNLIRNIYLQNFTAITF